VILRCIVRVMSSSPEPVMGNSTRKKFGSDRWRVDGPFGPIHPSEKIREFDGLSREGTKIIGLLKPSNSRIFSDVWMGPKGPSTLHPLVPITAPELSQMNSKMIQKFLMPLSIKSISVFLERDHGSIGTVNLCSRQL
jgi:hypothetical protein